MSQRPFNTLFFALSFDRGNKVIEKAVAEAINHAPKHSFVIASD
jgi:hypothetical protein